MRYVIVSSEPAGAARGSGTAVAISRLRAALRDAGVSAPVMRPKAIGVSQTLTRARFNDRLAQRELFDTDAVLGVNGDGWRMAEHNDVPFVALVKAFYAGAARYERGVTRRLLDLQARWEQEGARHAAAVIVPSSFAADAVIHEYGVDRRHVHVVTEPFDVNEWRAALPRMAPDRERVLCVARLYPRKRLADLLAAWPAVHDARPQARLDIVGGGPQLRHLAHAARGLHSCRVHGHVAPNRLPQLYARAAVFCLPSGQETFGYAVVEAMASGMRLVVSGSGSLPEISAGADAEVVPEGDVHALSVALIAALERAEDERDRERSVQRAYDFDAKRSARRLIDVVTHVQSSQRRAGGSPSRSAGSRR